MKSGDFRQKLSGLFQSHGNDEDCSEHCCCGDECDCREGCSPVNGITIIRIIAAAVLFVAGIIVNAPVILEFIIFFAAFLIAGYDVIIEGVECLIKRKTCNERLLMSIAGLGAFAIREFAEGAIVMIIYQIGEALQEKATASSRRQVSELVGMRPDTVTIMDKATLTEIPAEEVKPGMIMAVKPGERFAVDCIITEGTSSVDTSALTGESLPRSVAAGDEVLAGTVNIDSNLYARVKHEAADSAVSRILELVEKAGRGKTKSENTMSRFAKIYTPAVIILALLIAFMMPLVAGQALGTWVHRGLIFLVISCPCAIVISLPLTYFSGIGGAARKGVLFKSAIALDAMADLGAAVFDKTGTLTTGTFEISRIYANGIDEESLLMLAAYVEAFSTHPLAQAIKTAYGRQIDVSRISEETEEHGRGVASVISGVRTYAGNASFMQSLGIATEGGGSDETTVYVAIENKLAGYIVLEDTVKSDAAAAMYGLRKAGVTHTALLTGDKSDVAQKIAGGLSINEVHAECMPESKMEFLQQIITRTAEKKQCTAFIGDGINDAPALRAADIGIAMGGMGSDSAIESADIVIMDDRLIHLVDAAAAAKNTRKIVKQNIIISLAIKLVVMILGIFGIATMWFAVFADVGTAIVAVINASRALNVNNNSLL